MQKNCKLGLGTMGMSFANKEMSIQTIHKALENGINIFNTGDFYQRGESQVVLGEALRGVPREDYFVSLKFGVSFTPQGAFLDMNPKNIRGYLLDSLDKMGLDFVDLYQPARLDTEIPVEDVIGEIKSLIDEGYVKNIGLSEVDGETLRRAYKVYPIHSVEVEYSLLNREIERDLIQTAQELGVNVVVYGAVGHGVLTDKVFDGTMMNPMLSRGVLSPEYREHNLLTLARFRDIAESLDVSMSELALAWTQAKYSNIISLMGTSNPEHLLSSINAMKIKLDSSTVKNIEDTVSSATIKGITQRKWVFTNGVGVLKS